MARKNKIAVSGIPKSLLVILANEICREHGQRPNRGVVATVYLATGRTRARSAAWKWLAAEFRRRNSDAELPPRKRHRSPPPADFYASREWRDLRFRALKRSNGCCTLCGRSPREHGIVLHVDHIKPRSRFPDLELRLSNLQVLCEDCNLGKSNRDDTDWRYAPQPEEDDDFLTILAIAANDR
jgi:hypothetical protein